MSNETTPRYVRTPGYDETDTRCSVNPGETAIVYLVRDEKMTPLGDKARRELLESERALAEQERRVTRFISLVPVWCLNATSDIVDGHLTPEVNRLGRDRDGKTCKICATPGCNHPVGKKSVPRKGTNFLFCGGCAAALAIVATKAGRTDLVPIDAEKARVAAEKARSEKAAAQAALAALAINLLGSGAPTKVVNGKLVSNPFATALATATPEVKSPAEAKPRQPRPNSKKARKAAAATPVVSAPQPAPEAPAPEALTSN